MKVESETQPDYQAKLTVTIDNEQLDNAKHRAAKRISRNRKIPGFRPGKAPYPVVARTVGDAALVEEALEILVDEVYPEALDQAGVNPYGPGVLNNVESMDPPVFEFIVPLAPKVTLGDYEGIRIPYTAPAPSEEEVANVLQEIREGQAVIEPLDQPSQPGDIVYLTLRGESVDPNNPDNRETLVENRKLNILIQSAEDEFPSDEWPFPGFNQELLSVTSGNTRSIEYEYPDEEDYGIFRNKLVTFTASIDEVVSRELPELDDEFAQSLGEYESLKELEDYITTSLQESATRNYDEEYNDQILDEVVERSDINFPPQMLDHEIGHMIEHLESQLAGMGMDLDVYLKTRQMSQDDLEAEMKPDAERMIKRSLALIEIIKKEDIQVDREEVQEDLNRTMDVLNQSTKDKDRNRRSSSQTIARETVESQLINRRLESAAFKRLREIASGELDGSAVAAVAGEPETAKAESETGPGEEAPKKKRATKKKTEKSAAAKTKSSKSTSTKRKSTKAASAEKQETESKGKEQEND